jgi:uncharacterized protein (TIGR04255 family)
MKPIQSMPERRIMGETSLINYENPPLIEVVCGIMFKPITTLLTPHFGVLWERFKSEYPNCREVAPLTAVIEQFGSEREVAIGFTDVPPLPRIWFIHKEENGIIQVQRDRFIINWRKVRAEDEYPRYHHVNNLFRKSLSQFEAFLKENKIGEIAHLQYEMTYINHIPQKEGWETLEGIGELFPDFPYRSHGKRILPGPEGINFRMRFELPNQAGRLHVNVRSAELTPTKTPIILLELTARGIGPDKTGEGMWKWFDLAHEWIVYGFADLTSEEVQRKIWKRKD